MYILVGALLVREALLLLGRLGAQELGATRAVPVTRDMSVSRQNTQIGTKQIVEGSAQAPAGNRGSCDPWNMSVAGCRIGVLISTTWTCGRPMTNADSRELVTQMECVSADGEAILSAPHGHSQGGDGEGSTWWLSCHGCCVTVSESDYDNSRPVFNQLNHFYKIISMRTRGA
jgi:hypothetical protein